MTNATPLKRFAMFAVFCLASLVGYFIAGNKGAVPPANPAGQAAILKDGAEPNPARIETPGAPQSVRRSITEIDGSTYEQLQSLLKENWVGTGKFNLAIKARILERMFKFQPEETLVFALGLARGGTRENLACIFSSAATADPENIARWHSTPPACLKSSIEKEYLLCAGLCSVSPSSFADRNAEIRKVGYLTLLHSLPYFDLTDQKLAQILPLTTASQDRIILGEVWCKTADTGMGPCREFMQKWKPDVSLNGNGLKVGLALLHANPSEVKAFLDEGNENKSDSDLAMKDMLLGAAVVSNANSASKEQLQSWLQAASSPSIQSNLVGRLLHASLGRPADEIFEFLEMVPLGSSRSAMENGLARAMAGLPAEDAVSKMKVLFASDTEQNRGAWDAFLRRLRQRQPTLSRDALGSEKIPPWVPESSFR